MRAGLDTNVLLRLANPLDSDHPLVQGYVDRCLDSGAELRILPQNLYEFWVVATRPVANNGLGLSTDECDQVLRSLEEMFPCLVDPSDLPDVWRKLVKEHGCRGKVAHDARLVAGYVGCQIRQIVTLNSLDFRRFEEIQTLDPRMETGLRS